MELTNLTLDTNSEYIIHEGDDFKAGTVDVMVELTDKQERKFKTLLDAELG